MKRTFGSRKTIILVSQIVAGLVVLSILLLTQLGAFAWLGDSGSANSPKPSQAEPAMLTATNTPQASATAPAPEPAPAEEPSQQVGGNSSQGNGVTPAQKECDAMLKSTFTAAGDLIRQASELWQQINALQSSAAATSDQAESANLQAQANALIPEAQRLNDLSTQMQQERYAGHRGVGCNANGIYYFD